MSSENFIRSYELLQMSLLREIPEISIFAKREINTMKISIFHVTSLIKLVILQSHIFKTTVHGKLPVNDKWLQDRERAIEKL